MAKSLRLKEANINPEFVNQISFNAIVLAQNANWSMVGNNAQALREQLVYVLKELYKNNKSYYIPDVDDFYITTISVNLQREIDLNYIFCSTDIKITSANKLYTKGANAYYYDYLLKLNSDPRKHYLF